MRLFVNPEDKQKIVENDNLSVRLLTNVEPKATLSVDDGADLKANLGEDEPLKVEVETGGTNNYNKLFNKPTLNGKIIQGDMHEIDPTVPEWVKNLEVMTEQELDDILV